MRNLEFRLTKDQWAKLGKWIEEQDAKVALKQSGTGNSLQDKPYYGCSGGGYTFSFTPTTLGMVEAVTNNITKESINLTEFDTW